MFLHVNVRNDVVVLQCVLSRPEVPRLLLGVVITIFEAFKLIVKVDHIIGLFVPQSGVLVLCQHVNHVLLLSLLNSCLRSGALVHLSNWVVERLLLFDELGCHLFVCGGITLEVALLVNVVVDVFLPIVVAERQVVLLGKLANICN